MPSLVPNYLTTDAAGNVGANFTGHVSALGLDLPAYDAGTVIPTDRQVRWILQADGSAVARIYGQSVIPGEQRIVMGTLDSKSLVDVSNANGGQLDLHGDHTVNVQALNNFRVLIDEFGHSDFMQMGNSRMVADGGQGSAFANRNFNIATGYAGTYLCLAGFSGFDSGGGAGSTTNDLVIDGVARQTRTFFFNQAGVHTWVSFYAFTVTLTAALHTWRFSSNGGTIPLSADANDAFFFVLI